MSYDGRYNEDGNVLHCMLLILPPGAQLQPLTTQYFASTKTRDICVLNITCPSSNRVTAVFRMRSLSSFDNDVTALAVAVSVI
jgi:hypothetical protein